MARSVPLLGLMDLRLEGLERSGRPASVARSDDVASKQLTDAGYRHLDCVVGDNLAVARGIPSGVIQLTYMDIPFNKRKDHVQTHVLKRGTHGNRTVSDELHGNVAANTVDELRYSDVFKYGPHSLEYEAAIASACPEMAAALERFKCNDVRAAAGHALARFLEACRVAKIDGTIILHCDSELQFILQTCLEAWEESRTHGAWRYTLLNMKRVAYRAGRAPVSGTEYLFFCQNGEAYFDPNQYVSDEDARAACKYRDARGRLCKDGGKILLNPARRKHDAAKHFFKFQPVSAEGKRAWPHGKEDYWAYSKESLAALDAAGGICWIGKNGRTLQAPFKYVYPDNPKFGGPLSTSIGPYGMGRNEYLSYPTQKSTAFARAMIHATTRPGDIVFEMYCGSAPFMWAADASERLCIGCDNSEAAVATALRRFDINGIYAAKAKRLNKAGRPVDFTVKSNVPRHVKVAKYKECKGMCPYCEIVFLFDNLTIDHIVPRAEGGTDDMENLDCVCGSCNLKKGTLSKDAALRKAVEGHRNRRAELARKHPELNPYEIQLKEWKETDR